jgi:hypothetical protein
LAVLGEVVEAVGLANEIQEQLRVGERLTAHCASKYVRSAAARTGQDEVRAFAVSH